MSLEKNITAEFNKFLESYEATTTVGEEFMYEEANNLIIYSLDTDIEEDNDFIEYVRSLDKNIKFNALIMSFLHELGHHETLHLFSDEEFNEFAYFRDDMDSLEYFNSPLEKEATIWAISFANECGDQVSELWNSIKDLVIEYYTNKNDIRRCYYGS